MSDFVHRGGTRVLQKHKCYRFAEAYQYPLLLYHVAYCTHSESCSPKAQVLIEVGGSCLSFQSGYSNGQHDCG